MRRGKRFECKYTNLIGSIRSLANTLAGVDGTLQNGYPSDMADITKCTGEGCPIKDTCYRHTAPNSEQQSWFVDIPGKWKYVPSIFLIPGDLGKREFKCNMYWGEQQDAIMDTLNTIFKGQ